MAAKIYVRAELVGSPVEEWTEWRVYKGREQMGSYSSPEKADAAAKRMQKMQKRAA